MTDDEPIIRQRQDRTVQPIEQHDGRQDIIDVHIADFAQLEQFRLPGGRTDFDGMARTFRDFATDAVERREMMVEGEFWADAAKTASRLQAQQDLIVVQAYESDLGL